MQAPLAKNADPCPVCDVQAYTMASESQGINQLLAAEEEANQIIRAAREGLCLFRPATASLFRVVC